MLKQDDYIKSRLVEMGWRWAAAYNGGYMAGLIVMNTIANRVRCGWGSWLDVVDNIPKFMAENEMPALKHPPVWEANFMKLLHGVDGVFDGSTPDLSKGALYWGDLAHIERPWFKNLINAVNPAIVEDGSGLTLRQHPLVASVNSLSFFR